ncbi:hypothetical protein [Streptomyces albus]|uniref:hypothetical protein n=1 Tax=Streptomyces albus TaxID=1888 RepID=UPI003F1B7926
MRKRSFSLSDYGLGWPANRRILLVASVLSGLLIVAGLVAWFTGRSDRSAPPAGRATHSAAPHHHAHKPGASSGSVPRPPQTRDPVAYAKAAAAVLWSYDTRTTSRDQQLDGMQTWMTAETQYRDWTSVSGQVPDPTVWSRMADQDQRASAKVSEAHYPAAFKQALADDPSAITEAYIYAVTVTGKQTISWEKDGGGAEERSATLAVQCRPSHDCALVSLAPNVAP